MAHNDLSLVAAFTAQALVLYMLPYWSNQLSIQEPLHNPAWCSWPSLPSLLSSMMILCSCCWSILIAICQQINIQWQSSLFQSGSQYITLRHVQMLILILYRLEWYDCMLTYSNRDIKCMRPTCPVNYKWCEDELSFVLQSNEKCCLTVSITFDALELLFLWEILSINPKRFQWRSFVQAYYWNTDVDSCTWSVLTLDMLLIRFCWFLNHIMNIIAMPLRKKNSFQYLADSPNPDSLYQHNDSCSGVSIVELGSTLGM